MMKIFRKIKNLFYISISWTLVPFIFILRFIFPKKYIIFIGRDNSLFLDNVKYLYLYFHNRNLKLNNLKYIFLTEDKQTYNTLKRNKLPVVFYPSWASIKVLLQSKILIVDNFQWIKNLKSSFLFPVFKIQLWHGIGFKYIELLNKKDKSIQGIKGLLNFRNLQYDVVISTSEFYTKNVFSRAFKTKKVWETGYPRNDIFFREITDLDLINVDVNLYRKVLFYKKQGYKIILYAPTFRDSGGDPIKDGAIDLEDFEKFLKRKKIILIIKFHPDPNFKYPNIDNYKNIFIYPQRADIYPVLKYINILITDYSSIFMDFLLLDRPIVFFPYDYKKYIKFDRVIQFDYNWITPGVKVFNFKNLLEALEQLLKGEDNFKKKRAEIRKLAWKYVDGNACKRIVNNLKNIIKDL